MERFPALGLIVKYGAPGAIVFALAFTVLLAALVWPLWDALGLAVGLGGGAVVYLLAKSFVELVIILTEMLVPR